MIDISKPILTDLAVFYILVNFSLITGKRELNFYYSRSVIYKFPRKPPNNVSHSILELMVIKIFVTESSYRRTAKIK